MQDAGQHTDGAQTDPPGADASQPDPPAAPPAPTDPGVASLAAKADLGRRFVAILIDAVIAGVIATVIPAIGGLIGAAYMIVRDGLDFEFMNNRSIGKQIMKLHVDTLDAAPIDVMTSLRRNWMFGIGYLIPLLLFIPVLGWIAIPFVALASIGLGIVEIVLVLTDDRGRRVGDRMANTMVADDV
jgi:uncharacterized RDD family membrane protein YckC